MSSRVTAAFQHLDFPLTGRGHTRRLLCGRHECPCCRRRIIVKAFRRAVDVVVRADPDKRTQGDELIVVAEVPFPGTEPITPADAAALLPSQLAALLVELRPDHHRGGRRRSGKGSLKWLSIYASWV